MNVFRPAATFLALSALLMTAISCAPSVALTIKSDGSATASFTGALGTAGKGAYMRASGQERLPAFDQAALEESLSGAGLTVLSVSEQSDSGLFFDAKIQSLSAVPLGLLRTDPSGKRITIHLSPETLTELVSYLPGDAWDTLDLLMAPVFTGETLSEGEYQDVIAAAYGKSLGNELALSHCVISVTCPATITRVSVTAPGTVVRKGATAVISIPLSALLTLQKPLIASINW